MTAWLRLRRLGSTPKAIGPKVEQRRCRARSWRNARASFRQNGKQKAGALQRRQTGAFAHRWPQYHGDCTRAMPPVRETLTVMDRPMWARRHYRATCRRHPRAAAETSDVVRWSMRAIDGDERHVAAPLEPPPRPTVYYSSSIRTFRSEVAAIRRLTARASRSTRFEQGGSIQRGRSRCNPRIDPQRVARRLSVPDVLMPLRRAGQSRGRGTPGAVRIETRRPSADIDALTKLLARDVRPTPGHTLQFTTSS